MCYKLSRSSKEIIVPTIELYRFGAFTAILVVLLLAFHMGGNVDVFVRYYRALDLRSRRSHKRSILHCAAVRALFLVAVVLLLLFLVRLTEATLSEQPVGASLMGGLIILYVARVAFLLCEWIALSRNRTLFPKHTRK